MPKLEIEQIGMSQIWMYCGVINDKNEEFVGKNSSSHFKETRDGGIPD